jgi:hypothetical protein
VSDFEAAVAALQFEGVELVEPDIERAYKAEHVRNPDPTGHRVHLPYNPAV